MEVTLAFVVVDAAPPPVTIGVLGKVTLITGLSIKTSLMWGAEIKRLAD